MTLEREIIIDLLPAYFSGEASAATCALVEEYFREHPDFEKTARDASAPLDELKVPVSLLDAEREKLAFERARQVRETSASFLWMAILFSILPFIFRIHDHKIVWIFWENPEHSGVVMFIAAAIFLWILFFTTRKLKEPPRAHTKFLWTAIFYTALLGIFAVKNHHVVWYFNSDPVFLVAMGCVAVGTWIAYFILRRQK